MPEPILITEAEAGQRLDHVLSGALAITRGAARRLIDAGIVRVSGRPPRKGVKLAVGDVVEVLGEVEATPLPDADGRVSILAEGDGWVIVDKPAGMAVHPLQRDERGTVTNGLIYRFPKMAGVGEGGLRSGVVHRLDVTTSGCLLVATEETAWRRFRRAFAEHRTRKIYQALVEGQVTSAGESVLSLAVTRHRPARVSVVAEGGTPCNLGWRPLRPCGRNTLIEVTLGTGFLHQVRVMLAHHGHPLVGDVDYGAKTEAPRPMLHAAELSVEDAMAVAPMPADLATACDDV